MYVITNILLSSLISFLLTYFFIPIFKRKLWVSIPNERTSHRGIIPVGGSIGFILVTLFYFLIDSKYKIILFLILALVGLADDLNNLSTRFRLIVQSFIGIIYCSLIFNQSVLALFYMPDTLVLIKIGLVALMSFIFVSIINFTNFADGLDGLLTGSMIVLFSSASYLVDSNFLYVVGGLIGFLILNWYPAKVFMGDSGSYFLGALYFSAIFTSGSWVNFFSLIIIGSPLFVDTITCVIRRYLDKQNIFRPHKLHLFQRLNQSGLSHWQVSLLYISMMFLLSLSSIFGSFYFLIFMFVLIMFFGIYLDRFIALPFKR